MEKKDFLPVILGSDSNAYGIARAFHEEYGVESIVLTKGDLLPTMYSNIIKKIYIDDLDNPDTFAHNLLNLWPKLYEESEKIILLSCNENYAELCIRNRRQLENKFILPYVTEELMENLIYKENFYEMAENYGLDFPNTFLLSPEMNLDFELPFDFPVVLKASDSVSYFESKFEGKEKAYVIYERETLNKTIQNIFTAYKDNLIIQEYIPGGDDTMRVLNAYVDQNHKVRLMALGRIVLEDPTPILLGNYVAIVPEYDKELYNKYKEFLESISFTGFANIDLKFDKRDGKYKIFELNIRQGRSSYFVTASGYNLMIPLVEDRIYNNPSELTYGDGDVLWHTVPLKIVKKYVKDPTLKLRIIKLIKEKKTDSTMDYKKDFNFIKYLKLARYYHGYYERFKKYFKNK